MIFLPTYFWWTGMKAVFLIRSQTWEPGETYKEKGVYLCIVHFWFYTSQGYYRQERIEYYLSSQ